ncbi:hypothetical protein BO70DRAFT_425965 [Aspergillus heteromorphus CBS 117.55]|uniref:Uncharacterized protein n=1 Tax=Aspergillus heteromorphus CBS 117.55 TaxID=1448321 RepID=A0A317WXD3_9EURO|nr:uncharacterized protein BO70DRAFT_425965 [Aspergillus heteromorphus CBS 117.55]PWY91054.1 hypothetical protein BO70DRAFT_425965 [Aspergillus heteromorphus CBS 117.55]
MSQPQAQPPQSTNHEYKKLKKSDIWKWFNCQSSRHDQRLIRSMVLKILRDNNLLTAKVRDNEDRQNMELLLENYIDRCPGLVREKYEESPDKTMYYLRSLMLQERRSFKHNARRQEKRDTTRRNHHRDGLDDTGEVDDYDINNPDEDEGKEDEQDSEMERRVVISANCHNDATSSLAIVPTAEDRDRNCRPNEEMPTEVDPPSSTKDISSVLPSCESRERDLTAQQRGRCAVTRVPSVASEVQHNTPAHFSANHIRDYHSHDARHNTDPDYAYAPSWSYFFAGSQEDATEQELDACDYRENADHNFGAILEHPTWQSSPITDRRPDLDAQVPQGTGFSNENEYTQVRGTPGLDGLDRGNNPGDQERSTVEAVQLSTGLGTGLQLPPTMYSVYDFLQYLHLLLGEKLEALRKHQSLEDDERSRLLHRIRDLEGEVFDLRRGIFRERRGDPDQPPPHPYM